MSTNALDRGTLSQLRQQIAGPLYLDGDAGLEQETAAFNAAMVHRPAVTAGATSAEDVAAAVRWAATRKLPVAVQATGHGARSGVRDALLVCTHRMNDVTIDAAAGTARVGAGTPVRRILDAAAPYGLAPVSGSYSGVGMVGYTTGGGLALMGRTFGFGADHVRSFEMVTPDGQIRQVDAGGEPDLFWAVRGGKSSFGIVTSMTIDLVPLRSIFGGAVYYPGESAAAVLHAFREWAPALPDQANTSVALLRLPPIPDVPPPLAGRFTVGLRFAYAGDPGEGERLLAPMRQVAPAIIDTVGEMAYTRCDEVHSDPTHPLPFFEKGGLLGDLPGAAVDRLLEVAGPGAQMPLLLIEVRLLGGALGRQPREPNAASGREGAYSLFTVGVLMPEIAAIVPEVSAALFRAMAPWTTGGAALNLMGQATPEELAAAWPAATYQRLQAIKRRVDPDNLFRGGHAIAL
jgi:hypothetical protein